MIQNVIFFLMREDYFPTIVMTYRSGRREGGAGGNRLVMGGERGGEVGESGR